MSGELAVRVRVLEAWEDTDLSVDPSMSIGALKRKALDDQHIPDDPDGFLVKFRGAELTDESRTLADQRVPPGAALIVLRRRRQPVR